MASASKSNWHIFRPRLAYVKIRAAILETNMIHMAAPTLLASIETSARQYQFATIQSFTSFATKPTTT